MKAYVIGSTGKALMPTSPVKARHLLKAGKTSVYRKVPFTIKLNYQTGGVTQNGVRGWDTGEQHIGYADVCSDKVLSKCEWELRKSMDKRKLMKARKELRRNRRYRKTRYRHPKFRFHTKRVYVPDGYKTKHGIRHWKKVSVNMTSSRPEGWLPPSMQSKVNHYIHLINVMRSITPAKWTDNIEIARFDIQRMINPDIHNELYQQGRLYEFENVKAYVLAKFKSSGGNSRVLVPEMKARLL